MKTEHLHDIWAGPDNTRLTSKQFSFRFPVHIAAKIAALCEMYPTKNRTQIVADLLTAALDHLEKNLPEEQGAELDGEDRHIEQMIANQEGREYEALYYLGGARGRFHDVANRHYRELEMELGSENPSPLYPVRVFAESHFKKK